MRAKKLRPYDVVVPVGGIYKTITVTARSNYLAKVQAGKSLGVLKPGSGHSRFTHRVKITRRKR